MTTEVEMLYEDGDVLVINKPAGLLVHPDGSSDDKTLVDWVLEKFPELANVGEEMKLKDGTIIKRPGIVHRLDRDTSGAMIIAKNQNSFENLKSQFKNREIKKAYLAIVSGVFKNNKDKGVIDLPIGRSPRDFRRWSAQPGSRGNKREAVTEYFILEQVDNNALVFLQPLTGRTHQLRVHLKAIHHPIIGDELYGDKNSRKSSAIDRQALHARAITWQKDDRSMEQVLAPLPVDFIGVLQSLGFNYQ